MKEALTKELAYDLYNKRERYNINNAKQTNSKNLSNSEICK